MVANIKALIGQGLSRWVFQMIGRKPFLGICPLLVLSASLLSNDVIAQTLTINKTNSQTIYATGQTFSYTVVIGNTGASNALNVIFKDPAISGFTVSGVSCAVTAGNSTCPTTANTTIALMQGTGITIPIVAANGGSVTFTITGTVPASNAPAAANLVNVANVTLGGTTVSSADSDAPQPALAACGPPLYLSQGSTTTTLYTIKTDTKPFSFTTVYASAISYNALGYNQNDKFLYAIQTNTNTLLKIGSDGIPIALGAVTNLPTANYISGEISPTGVYYVKSTGGNLYSIDFATRAATAIPVTPPAGTTANFGSDLAWYNGALYTVDPYNAAAGGTSGILYKIDPATGAVTKIGPTGLGSSNPALNFGSLYGATTGLYGNENTGTGFYRFDPSTGTATLISTSNGATTNDGAHCASAPTVFTADLGITKTDNSSTYQAGKNVVYTIKVKNAGPYGASNVTVSDPIPTTTPAITASSVSWGCTVDSDAPVGTACGAASGTGAINQAGNNLPAATTTNPGGLTYTFTIPVPSTFTGTLTNTATVTGDAGSVEPIPDTTNPNTATDTDSQYAVDLSITKTNGTNVTALASGATTTYTITVINSGTTAVPAGAKVQDGIASGLTCLPANTVTCTGTDGNANGTGCPTTTPLTVSNLTSGVNLTAMPAAVAPATQTKVTLSFNCTVN